MRTVVVVACDGAMGEARSDGGTPRLDELPASARALGVAYVARVAHLAYADSGHGPLFFPDPPDRMRFARAPVGEAAERLAAILREELAEILFGYDANGGYGQRDHIRVHDVALRAAQPARTPRLLQATVPRAEIHPHRIDARPYAAQKRAVLACRVSVLGGSGRSARLFRPATRTPVPVFAFLFGREFYSERSVEQRPPSDGVG